MRSARPRATTPRRGPRVRRERGSTVASRNPPAQRNGHPRIAKRRIASIARDLRRRREKECAVVPLPQPAPGGTDARSEPGFREGSSMHRYLAAVRMRSAARWMWRTRHNYTSRLDSREWQLNSIGIESACANTPIATRKHTNRPLILNSLNSLKLS
jgi:hypothetical protein